MKLQNLVSDIKNHMRTFIVIIVISKDNLVSDFNNNHMRNFIVIFMTSKYDLVSGIIVSEIL